MFLSIVAYNTAEGIEWRMSSVRPASQVRQRGLYVWHRSGSEVLDIHPVTSRAMIQALLDALQRALGERERLGGDGD